MSHVSHLFICDLHFDADLRHRGGTWQPAGPVRVLPSFWSVTWLIRIRIRDMTHSYAIWLIHMRHDSSIWVCHVTIGKRHDSSIRDMTHSYETWGPAISVRVPPRFWSVTWLIYTWHDSFICDTTHWYETWLIHMQHDLFIRDMTRSYETWLIWAWWYVTTGNLRASASKFLVCDMTHSHANMRHVSCIWDTTHPCKHGTWRPASPVSVPPSFWSVTWLIHMQIRDMIHSYLTWLIDTRHDAFICDVTRSYVTWLIDMRHDSFICDMTRSYVTWLSDMSMRREHRQSPCHCLQIFSLWHACQVLGLWHDSFICEYVDRNKPPLPGGFPIYYVPSSRTV